MNEKMKRLYFQMVKHYMKSDGMEKGLLVNMNPEMKRDLIDVYSLHVVKEAKKFRILFHHDSSLLKELSGFLDRNL